MDARKLVGMTMGARKRALMGELDQIAEHVVAANGSASDVNRLLRPRYEFWRIGQRLRPCPGCKDCGTGKSGRTWRLRLGDQLWISGSLKVKDPAHICDGSGVIPAKARKVR